MSALPDDARQAAEQIAVEAKRAAKIARAHGLDSLAYLLEVAVLEAEERARKTT